MLDSRFSFRSVGIPKPGFGVFRMGVECSASWNLNWFRR